MAKRTYRAMTAAGFLFAATCGGTALSVGTANADTTTPVPPTATLNSGATGNEALPDTDVSFSAAASKPGGTAAIQSYTFDFGDGSDPVVQSTPDVTHSFDDTGEYSVTLTVTDDDGATATKTLPFFSAYPAPQPETGDPDGSEIADTGLTMWVGIMDDHHHHGTVGVKPDPWCTGAVAAPANPGDPALGDLTFEGSSDDNTMCGAGWDTPGIRIKNTTDTPQTVNLDSVTIPGVAQNLVPGTDDQTAGNHAGSWGGHWTPVTLAPGQEIVFAQWYDPSLPKARANTFDPGDTNIAGNSHFVDQPGLCDFPSPAVSTINVNVNGTSYALQDENQVLNEHGVDAAGCPSTYPGRNDESTPWVGLS